MAKGTSPIKASIIKLQNKLHKILESNINTKFYLLFLEVDSQDKNDINSLVKKLKSRFKNSYQLLTTVDNLICLVVTHKAENNIAKISRQLINACNETDEKPVISQVNIGIAIYPD